MSLDDINNPNDGGLIDTVDSVFYKLNRKIAETWQNKTHKPEKNLRKGLFAIGAVGFLGYAVQTSRYLSGVTAVLFGAISANPDPWTPKGGLETEIMSESLGWPSKTIKILTILMYSTGVSETARGLGYLIHGVANNDNESFLTSAKLLSIGIGCLAPFSALYMGRGDYEDPPPKPKKRPILERIKEKIEVLSPQPVPQPVPVEEYSTLEIYAKAQH